MLTDIRRILFDLDGTIIIHNKDNETKELSEILGLNKEQEKILDIGLQNFFSQQAEVMKGKIVTWDRYFSIIERFMPFLAEWGITPRMFEDAIIQKVIKYSQVSNETKDTLEYLKSKGYELCIATNGMYDSQVKCMKGHNILDYFNKVYAWDSTYPKPDIRFLYRSLSEVDAKNTLMVGDSLTDIIVAKKAGMKCISTTIPYKWNKKEPIANIHIFKFEQLKELL